MLEHAVNEGLDGFFRAAVAEHELQPLGRPPEADIVEWPNEKDFSGDLLLSIEVDVRPEIELPPAYEASRSRSTTSRPASPTSTPSSSVSAAASEHSSRSTVRPPQVTS